MRIAVLGVGLIGGSIGLAAQRRLEAEVIGFDPAPGAVEAALEHGALSVGAQTVAEAVSGADIVFCAAPVGRLPELVREALDASSDETVVTDVGSTKLDLVEGVAALPRRRPVHRRPPDRGRGDGGGRKRPRRALRWRPVVPDARRAGRRAFTTTAFSARSPTWERARRQSTPSSTIVSWRR